MTEITTGSGGAGTGTGSGAGSPGAAPSRRHSAAKVRRSIVRVMAPDKQMTPDEVQRDVATLLGADERASIEAQLRALRDGDYVKPVAGDARKVTLTDSGRRWSRGINALSAGGRT